MLNRDQILKAAPRTVEVDIPAWGGAITLRAYNLNSRLALLNAISANNDAVDAYEQDQTLEPDKRVGAPFATKMEHPILCIIYSAIDATGELVFTLADYDALAALDYTIILKLWVAVQELNDVLNVNASHAAKKKSSGTTPKSASRIGSRR